MGKAQRGRWDISDGIKQLLLDAKDGHLPANFDQWGLANNAGTTVGHMTVTYGWLPADFDRWELADEDGWTVAHQAAHCRHIPDNFNRWGLVDNNGLTVLGHILSSTQSDKYLSRWEKEVPLCKTKMDWEAFKKELPEVHMRFSVAEQLSDNGHTTDAIIANWL
jgi:hypothetical protein